MQTNPLNIGLKPQRGHKAAPDATLLVDLSALEVEVGPYLFVFKKHWEVFLNEQPARQTLARGLEVPRFSQMIAFIYFFLSSRGRKQSAFPACLCCKLSSRFQIP